LGRGRFLVWEGSQRQSRERRWVALITVALAATAILEIGRRSVAVTIAIGAGILEIRLLGAAQADHRAAGGASGAQPPQGLQQGEVLAQLAGLEAPAGGQL
jgi:hypothetical protein